ncbi:MAG: carboxypeptidase-like regulatory domain-containing protein, partial [Pyrodictiaceae archaeon]
MELLRIGLIVAFLAVILSLSVIAVSGMSATYSEAFNISELRRLGLPVVLELPIQGYADFVMVDEVRLGTLLVYHNEHGIHLVGYMGLEKIEKPYPSYPILGTPLSYAYDRQPVPSLIAIGSSMGEALVFNITSKSVKYWYLQSSPYTVDEVMISTNGTLVAYSTSGYLRLYDVKSPGWVEIGPIVGNAVNVSVSGVYVYSAKMLLTLNKTREHKDLVAILESTRNFPSQLEFQVFFYNFTANATMPVAGVEAYLFSHDAHAYSPVARSNKYGYIVLPIPIPTNNATLYVRYNNSCFTFELSGLNITEPGTRVKLSTPLLLSRPSKGLCPEPSEAMKLVLVKAREALRRRAVNVIEVGHFIAKGHPRILGFIEPSRTLSYGFKWRYVVILVGSFQYPFLRGAVNTPVLLLQYLDERFRPVDKTTWVPIQSEPTSIAYSSDGSLIAIGFSNGLIAVFGLDKVSGEYKLLWEYRMRSPVTALEYTERLGDNKSVHGLLALDVLGHLQLLALGDKLFAPLLRINATLSFNTGYGSTISSTKDTNLVVVSGQGKLIIIVGLGSAVSRSPVEPIDLSKALLRPFRVKVIEPDGTPVANATVEIYKNNILLYRRLTNKDGIAYIGLITPGTYTIVVRPTKDWLETRTLVFKANPGLSRYEVIIKLSYK